MPSWRGRECASEAGGGRRVSWRRAGPAWQLELTVGPEHRRKICLGVGLIGRCTSVKCGMCAPIK
jgi:hypothetical protein